MKRAGWPRRELDAFAAWRVEDRAEDQLLLCDLPGRTRSWLMAASEGTRTLLYFGSAIVPLSPGYRALLGFHKLYSRVLLRAAKSRLERRIGK